MITDPFMPYDAPTIPSFVESKSAPRRQSDTSELNKRPVYQEQTITVAVERKGMFRDKSIKGANSFFIAKDLRKN